MRNIKRRTTVTRDLLPGSGLTSWPPKCKSSAPQAFDLNADETSRDAAQYGLDNPVTEDFGRRCLLARRLVERGVRFVQVWSGANGPTGNWDNHASIVKELPPIAASIDQPIAGLLEDLKRRGMLDDTLVLWNTEFGRMPFSQSSEGRDHNGGAFVGWMAGAGVKPGILRPDRPMGLACCRKRHDDLRLPRHRLASARH